MPSFAIPKFIILLGPRWVSAVFLLLSTGPNLDGTDVIVVARSDAGSEFSRLDSERLKLWLDGNYTLGDLWKKNILGGNLSK